MKKLLRYLLPYKRNIAVSTLLMLISAVCNLTLPTLMSRILDQGAYGSAESYAQIARHCLGMLAIAALSLGAVIGGYFVSTRVSANFSRDVRNAMFRKIDSMSFAQVGKLGTAALVTRLTHDAGTLSWVAGMLCGNIVLIPLMFLGGVVMCMVKDLYLSLIMLAMVPLVFLLVLALAKKITPLWEISDKYTDLQNGIVRERIRGIRVIRAFGREQREHARIAEATTVMANNIIRANVTMELVAPIATLLMNFAVLGIVRVGALRLTRGTGLSAGDVFAVVQYVSIVLSSLISASWSIIMLPHARVAAGRISEITEAETVPDPVDNAPVFTGEITLEKASFCYEGADQAALDGVSLHIPAGARVAVIGGTGAGKSTLVSLLLAFRRPTAGRVLFSTADGPVDAAALSCKTIRRNVSCALQTPMLYAGTIAENIRMGDPEADDAAVAAAADDAQLGELLASREKGLSESLTTSGGNLSGGQKQRLSIARAMLKTAPIYIFDDSFSALDFLTEARLRAALNRRMTGKTQLIITQRVTTAMRSDMIFVLDQGRLVGQGTHETLLRECPIYREIYASQTGGGTV